jgi:hypothetical protein
MRRDQLTSGLRTLAESGEIRLVGNSTFQISKFCIQGRFIISVSIGRIGLIHIKDDGKHFSGVLYSGEFWDCIFSFHADYTCTPLSKLKEMPARPEGALPQKRLLQM